MLFSQQVRREEFNCKWLEYYEAVETALDSLYFVVIFGVFYASSQYCEKPTVSFVIMHVCLSVRSFVYPSA
jgi:hypothetical protein